MKKIYEKHETFICIALIVLYVVINSFCKKNFGMDDYRSTIINTLFSVALVMLIISFNRVSYYGLTKVKNIKDYLYFIPLVLIVSVNLWNGIHIDNTGSEILFHIVTMINVGFLEEMIFRGFLYRMIEKDNLKSAIAVSSFTFGIGHIVNLLSGAEVVSTLMQICYATSIGFLFAIIFYKSKSLVPCIIAHAIINALSIFNGDNQTFFYIISVFLVVVPFVYAMYIMKKVKE